MVASESACSLRVTFRGVLQRSARRLDGTKDSEEQQKKLRSSKPRISRTGKGKFVPQPDLTVYDEVGYHPAALSIHTIALNIHP
eukprot:959361-Pyramimonas_sp.AAC.1